MSLFHARLNKSLTVKGRTKTGTDGGGQPIYTIASKGTVLGRIDPKVAEEVQNATDLNPTVSNYLGILAIPSGFSVIERDQIVDGAATYEVLGVASLDGRSGAHHLELSLQRISA